MLEITNVIDSIVKRDNTYYLAIKDSGLIKDPKERLKKYQDKLGFYMHVVISEEFKEKFPHINPKEVRILFCYNDLEPTEEMKQIKAVMPPGKYEPVVEIDFENLNTESERQCPECHSTDLLDNEKMVVCRKCGLVIKEKNKPKKKFMEMIRYMLGKDKVLRRGTRGKWMKIKYRCPKCKAKGTLDVNQDFFLKGAPCPKCSEKPVKFKVVSQISWTAEHFSH